MEAFPRVLPGSPVSPADRMEAIDFVNRLNWLFETWDVEAMLDAFLPDGVAYHFHGTIRGREEMRRFFEHDYPYLIPGVSRHATNHIVDADEDGVEVRYHMVLLRYALPQDAASVRGGGETRSHDGLPAPWIYSPMRDRLRRTSEGWKIFERHVGGSMSNAGLSPPDRAPGRFMTYLHSLDE